MNYNIELCHHGIKGQKWGVRRSPAQLGYANLENQYKVRNNLLNGVKGQKWGVRRSPAQLGYVNLENQYKVGNNLLNGGMDRKRTSKKAAMVATFAMTATAAAVYAKNPATANRILAKIGKKAISTLDSKTVDKGKKYLTQAAKEVIQGAKEGVKDGLREAPRKTTKAITTGIALNSAKKILDSTIGKEESAKIFQAANSKKISSFWKVYGEDKDDDE